ncbi:hypothetical protein GMMP15_1660006 [Candidatus Magnetomoraceae bacterium gMMP-15]
MYTVQIAEALIHGMMNHEIQQEIEEALVIKRYLNGEMNMEKVARTLGISYIEAHKWMNKQGIATARKLPYNFKNIKNRNQNILHSQTKWTKLVEDIEAINISDDVGEHIRSCSKEFRNNFTFKHDFE